MTSKMKIATISHESKKYPRKALECHAGETEEEKGRNYAALVTSPELAAFRIIQTAEAKSALGEHIDVPTLMETLREQAGMVNRNDLSQAEAMLINQATALQSLFARLTERALSTDNLSYFEGLMRMALRAQNQCRTTLETLSDIKNPPVIFAKQLNIAQGHQQVNNSNTMPLAHAHAGKNEILQNELLEVQHGAEKMDAGATSEPIGNDPAMEALGEVHGRAHRRG